MEYFKLLNLKREPFSNSPDPDFFFLSLPHRECLRKLELSLRLKRGLNIITGDVGAGKTTLCREIIRRFSEDEDIETYLILDPEFENPVDFLKALCEQFSIDTQGLSDVSEFKEAVKRFLFLKGVPENPDEKLTPIVIIDEGQKLTGFSIEILRELLNYETNEHKLLQIVIFAQKEFEPVVKSHANFMDRITLFHILEPMSLGDTGGMIDFRIRQSADTEKPLPIFTRLAVRAVYKASGGYPRKIINICHQVLIALIVQNKKKAGHRLVRSCISRNPVFDKRRKTVRTRVIGALATAFLVPVIFISGRGFYQEHMSGPGPAAQVKEISGHDVEKTEVVGKESKPEPQMAVKKPQPEPVLFAEKQEMPVGRELKVSKAVAALHLGRVTVQKNDTLKTIVGMVYGRDNVNIVNRVLAVNPWLENPNFIQEGDVIDLPLLELPGIDQTGYRVVAASSEDLDALCKIARSRVFRGKQMIILPATDKDSGPGFDLVSTLHFTEKASARTWLDTFEEAWTVAARIVGK